MHRLRTCAARLRPLTASQTAQSLPWQRQQATPRTFRPVRCYTAPVAAEPFLNGTSSNYVEEMYYAWLENPKSVHKVRRNPRKLVLRHSQIYLPHLPGGAPVLLDIPTSSTGGCCRAPGYPHLMHRGGVMLPAIPTSSTGGYPHHVLQREGVPNCSNAGSRSDYRGNTSF